MENPTKAIIAKLTTIIAIAATSMVESRLRSNAMMRYLGGSRATALIWIIRFEAVRREREEEWR